MADVDICLKRYSKCSQFREIYKYANRQQKHCSECTNTGAQGVGQPILPRWDMADITEKQELLYILKNT